jgi:hypothetical protein
MVTTKQTDFSLTLGCSQYNTVTIEWGDGTNTLVNNGSAKLHTWVTGGNHTVIVRGLLNKITDITCSGQNLIELNLNDKINSLNTLQCYSNQLTSLILPSGLTTMNQLSCSSNQLTSLTLPSGLTTLQILGCEFNQLTSLTLPSTLTTMQYLYCYSNASLIPPTFSNIITVTGIQLHRCGFDQTEVDNIISQCITISNSDTACILSLDNGGLGGAVNSAPSAAGLANIATLQSRGWTVYYQA